jgi:hypothetical protein
MPFGSMPIARLRNYREEKPIFFLLPSSFFLLPYERSESNLGENK